MNVLDWPTRLLLIRHGHGTNQAQRRFLQHACTGLTETGVAQARTLAGALARDPTLTAPVVLASRAKRAIDTAEILAEALGVPVTEQSCDLCDLHPGAAEGLTPEELEREFGPVAGWTRPYQIVPGADNVVAWQQRTRAGLERIVATYPGQQILAVTHAGVIRVSFVLFGQLSDHVANQIAPANTAITEWSTTQPLNGPADVQWRLARQDDVPHLPAGLLDLQ
jgi:probable phosphoglycerate mutase